MSANPQTPPLIEEREPGLVSRAAFTVILAAFCATEIALFLVLQHGRTWLAVPLVVLAGHFMHGLMLAFHEATHGLLRRNRRWNDVDGVILGTMSFTPFNLFRFVHGT